MFTGDGLGSADVQDFTPRWRPVTGDRWPFADLVLAKWFRGVPNNPWSAAWGLLGICSRPALFALALSVSIWSYLVLAFVTSSLRCGRWEGASVFYTSTLSTGCLLPESRAGSETAS